MKKGKQLTFWEAMKTVEEGKEVLVENQGGDLSILGYDKENGFLRNKFQVSVLDTGWKYYEKIENRMFANKEDSRFYWVASDYSVRCVTIAPTEIDIQRGNIYTSNEHALWMSLYLDLMYRMMRFAEENNGIFSTYKDEMYCYYLAFLDGEISVQCDYREKMLFEPYFSSRPIAEKAKEKFADQYQLLMENAPYFMGKTYKGEESNG